MSNSSSIVYRYERGALVELSAPLWLDRDTLLAAGPTQPAAVEMLPAAIAAVEQIAPRTTVYFAPRVLCSVGSTTTTDRYRDEVQVVGGRDFDSCNGLCFPDPGVIVVSYRGATRLMSTVHHELFHRVERQLPAPTLALLRRAVSGARGYPGGYGDREEERLARLFQSFAEFLDEGGQIMWLNELDPNRSIHEALYWIFNGGLARWRADQAAARAAEDAKRARRAARWAAVRGLIGA